MSEGAPAEPFATRLAARSAAAGSVVCLGLDPRPGAHPLTAGHAADPRAAALAVARYLTAVMDATHDLVACCKPQVAFFEALGLPGLEALARVMAHARSLGLPVILDAKRGDIGTTAEAYARAYLAPLATRGGAGAELAADALTVNPYLGLDTLEPFIAAAESSGAGLFVLVRTSNPGSGDLQELRLEGGGALYTRLADALAARAASLPADSHGYSSLGIVAGATNPGAIRDLRARSPRSLLLVPGYGAQGAGAADVAHAFDANGWGAVVNASRGLSYPPAAADAGSLREVAAAARAAAKAMRDDLDRVRGRA